MDKMLFNIVGSVDLLLRWHSFFLPSFMSVAVVGL
jgi:hypothetical protein